MYRTVTHRCPRCRSVLDQASRWETCARCGGIWIAPKVFFDALHKALPDKRIDELMVHNDGTQRRPCPHCEQLMDIAWLDFLQLDQCGDHGIWLDPGEFEIAMSGTFSPVRMPDELDPHDRERRKWAAIVG